MSPKPARVTLKAYVPTEVPDHGISTELYTALRALAALEENYVESGGTVSEQNTRFRHAMDSMWEQLSTPIKASWSRTEISYDSREVGDKWDDSAAGVVFQFLWGEDDLVDDLVLYWIGLSFEE